MFIFAVGLAISVIMLLLVNITDLISGLVMLSNCSEDTYTPAYFIVAGKGSNVACVAISNLKFLFCRINWCCSKKWPYWNTAKQTPTQDIPNILSFLCV